MKISHQGAAVNRQPAHRGWSWGQGRESDTTGTLRYRFREKPETENPF